jgi:hypothetical protein
VRPLFIRPHQARISGHVGGEDCGETRRKREYQAELMIALDEAAEQLAANGIGIPFF